MIKRKVTLFLVLCSLYGGMSIPVAGQPEIIARWTFDTLEFTRDIIPLERKRRPAPEIHRVYSAIDDISGKREKCVSSDKYYNKMPTFSPDGKRVAFLSGGGNDEKKNVSKGFFNPKGIYMADSNGKNRHQMLSDRYYGSFSFRSYAKGSFYGKAVKRDPVNNQSFRIGEGFLNTSIVQI